MTGDAMVYTAEPEVGSDDWWEAVKARLVDNGEG